MIDYFNQVSDSQAVTATAVSTSSIDTQLPNRGLDVNNPLVMLVQATAAATAAGAATVTFELISATDAALTSGIVSHYTTAAIGKATLVQGYRIPLLSAYSTVPFKRYLGVRYTVATGPLTAGTFSAFLEATSLAYAYYVDNIAAKTM